MCNSVADMVEVYNIGMYMTNIQHRSTDLVRKQVEQKTSASSEKFKAHVDCGNDCRCVLYCGLYDVANQGKSRQ
jgi:hypothetical protein